ncbi:MAG: hypothetical protein K2K80_03740 [Clostridia bacterium]|nr:hypothetical protein [Clostridia bacterium]
MRYKKLLAVLVCGLMLSSISLAGCDTSDHNPAHNPAGEDITVDGIDKEDTYTWFDLNKTDLPSMEACRQIKEGMSLNQVIDKIGKPQRDIGYGAVLFQFDLADGSVFTVTFDKDFNNDLDKSDYDCLIVKNTNFDLDIPDIYFPYCGSLNYLYPWINALKEEDIKQVRFERAFIGVAPYHLEDVSYSTDSADIKNAYRLLSTPVMEVSPLEGQVTGGGYVKYDFVTANNQTYSIRVNNNAVFVNDRYYKFVGNFYYKFENPDLDCHSFITYETPTFDNCEVYTYATESVKVGNFEGLGELEFRKYEGVIENAPHYVLKNSEINLLILSKNQFMVEGEENTVIYQITGGKDFSALFEDNNG